MPLKKISKYTPQTIEDIEFNFQYLQDTIDEGGGGGGTGTVTSVAGVSPDGTGNVPLTASNVGAVATVAGQRLITTAEGTKITAIDQVYTTAEKTKLTGVATGATVNDTDVNLKNRANHTGVQTADTITQDATHRFTNDTDIAKLSNISIIKSTGWFSGIIPVGKFVAPGKGFSDGTVTGLTYSYWFRPKFNCTGVQFLFPNWTMGNSTGGAAAEGLGLNPVTIAVSIYNVSTRDVFFNGQTSITIPPGGSAKSDPSPYNFVAGTNYNLRVSVTVTTLGMKWPLGLIPQSTLTEGTFPAGTLSGGTLTNITTGGYGPFGIIAKPNTTPTFANIGLFGDSIFDGNSNGGTGIQLDQGWGRKWLDLINVPWVKFAVGGDKSLNHTTDGSFGFVSTYSTGIDIALTNYGANDIASATVFADVQAQYLKWWTTLANSGMRVVQATVFPRSSFGAPQEAIRIQLNDWIRTLPAPLWKYVDVADVVETARNSGVWKSNLQTDGTHPTATGETTIAAALPSASFFLP